MTTKDITMYLVAFICFLALICMIKYISLLDYERDEIRHELEKEEKDNEY